MQKWKENIRSIEPYIPGEQPQFSDMIKLNTNECPYPPSPMVEKVLKECNYSNLRLYPSFTFKPLKEIHFMMYGAIYTKFLLKEYLLMKNSNLILKIIKEKMVVL